LRVHWVGLGTRHPLVPHSHPLVITLLGSKAGKRREDNSGNGNSSDRARCQNSILLGGGEVSESATSSPWLPLNDSAFLGSEVAGSRETILGLVFLSVGNFPVLGVGICPVTRISNLIGEQANGGYVDASSSLIASGGQAIVAIVSCRASDRGQNASNGRIARRGRADVGLADNVRVNAAVSSIRRVKTVIIGACIAIIARTKNVEASSSGRVTAINRAQNTIVTVNRGDNARAVYSAT